MSVFNLYPTINPTLSFDFVNAGVLDPSVTFTRQTNATYFDETGILRVATPNTPRFDYNPATLAAQGFLIEEARTNRIRNNTMVGAVAGTPGTNPTNWSIANTLNGLTKEIVGTGTTNGITWIDLRWSGTTTGVGLTVAQPEGTTAITAATGQAWSASAWWAIVGGSTANITSVNQRVSGRSAAGSLLEQTDQPVTLTATLTRYTASHTMSNASTERVTNDIFFNYNSGVAIDITLRIGLPQLELGAFATSVIPTTTTALTRSADVASVNTLSPWFNATESTLYLEFTPVGLSSFGGQPLVEIDNGTANERIRMLATSANAMQNVTTVSGATSGSNVSPATTYVANTTYKVAAAIKLDDMQSFVGGVAGTTDMTALIPTGLTTLRFAANQGLGTQSNAWFRRFTYYPRRLSQAEGEAITA